MADLLISRVAPGVAAVRSVDPFDILEIHRIDRSRWQHVPETSGIYLLYGVSTEGKLTVYIGMSTTNMRGRVRSHHVDPQKNWFGVLFAVPVGNSLLCPAIEAELIGHVTEAGVVDVIVNVATERRHRGADDVHVEPAVEKIRDALQLVLGSDIFTPADLADPQVTDAPIARMPPLARDYRGQASQPRARNDDDPPTATHAYAGTTVAAWGRFEAEDPDKRFCVLAGSSWRRPVLAQDNATYAAHVRLAEQQDVLVRDGVLNPSSSTFTRHHVFENWNVAARVVSGKATYSGAYHWQLLAPQG